MRYHVGDVLDGYVLETECGSGAFGSVFLAKNRTLGQECALKILYKNGRQYEKELEGLKTYQKKCRHANLMRVDHVGENEECIFYTMDAADNLHPGGEYVADTLGNRLKEKSRLSPEEILSMVRDLLEGLSAMHGAGILHRDIKPDNILWVNKRAMLGDIGLISGKLEASMAGTPGFISPRVWTSRSFTPQDDLYALAMVMYCALNGNVPEDYPLPGSMPLTDSVQQIIHTYNEVLKPDSAVRTVRDFQDLLKKIPQRKMSKLLPIGIAAVIIAAVVIGVFSSRKPQPSVPPAPPRQPETVKPQPPPPPKTPPAPEPEPAEPPKPAPQVVPEIRVLPGTIYEVRLPSPGTEESPEEVLRVRSIYAGTMARIRKHYAEDVRLSAEIPRLEQLYETTDAMWGFQNDGTHLALTFPTEANSRLLPIWHPLGGKDFGKAYRERYRKSLEFLKGYSPKEQVRILYYAARRDESYFDMTANGNTLTNREALDRYYKAWTECHARMLKTRKDLLDNL